MRHDRIRPSVALLIRPLRRSRVDAAMRTAETSTIKGINDPIGIASGWLLHPGVNLIVSLLRVFRGNAPRNRGLIAS